MYFRKWNKLFGREDSWLTTSSPFSPNANIYFVFHLFFSLSPVPRGSYFQLGSPTLSQPPLMGYLNGIVSFFSVDRWSNFFIPLYSFIINPRVISSASSPTALPNGITRNLTRYFFLMNLLRHFEVKALCPIQAQISGITMVQKDNSFKLHTSFFDTL